MRLQVHQNCDESVQLVEVKLEHGQFRVEQVAQVVLLDDLPQHSERQCLVLHDQVEETSDEVHALAVVKVRVNNGVGLQDFIQVLRLNRLHVVEGSLHVHVYRVFNLLGQLQVRHLVVGLELSQDVGGVYFEDTEP